MCFSSCELLNFDAASRATTHLNLSLWVPTAAFAVVRVGSTPAPRGMHLDRGVFSIRDPSSQERAASPFAKELRQLGHIGTLAEQTKFVTRVEPAHPS
jgi:hypothetical protein